MAIFEKILKSSSGVKLSKHDYKDHWKLVKHPDNKVQLHIPEMLRWLDDLPEQLLKIEQFEKDYPFNLIAGERRAYNANTIIRNPEWRKMDAEGALKINPADAEHCGVEEGDTVKLTTSSGIIEILTKVTDEVAQGVLSMPHGHGLTYDSSDDYREVGAKVNMLTSTDYCDPLAKTPYHKNVRVKLEKVLVSA